MGIGGSQALFKSTILGLLAQVGGRGRRCRALKALAQVAVFCAATSYPAQRCVRLGPCTPSTLQFDWRVGALVRLVKLWARHHDVNDSTNGTLNSFALTLLVGASCSAGVCGAAVRDATSSGLAPACWLTPVLLITGASWM